MLKTIKRVIVSCLSVLGVTCLFWTLLLLNPKWSYANSTQFDYVTVYHNDKLEPETEAVVNAAIDIIKTSDLFNENVEIELCMNDDKIYPNLHPLAGNHSLAYAVLDKSIINNCNLNFKENIGETRWPVNNFEHRKFNLTWLLAHEFTHNLQFNARKMYVMKTTLGQINWKLEGHADYTARKFKNDGLLKAKIKKYQEEATKVHNGFPVFELEDGTKQIFSYYRYALIVQYLMEEQLLNFEEICNLNKSEKELYNEMISWSKK